MKVSTQKLQILTAAAIFLLISGGIAAYALNQPASAGAAGADQTTTSSTAQNSTSTATSGSSTMTTTSGNYTLCAPGASHIGRIVLPIKPTQSIMANGTDAITFAKTTSCYAAITTVGGIFSVHVLLRHTKPVTEYHVVLVANGTAYPVGSMVTGPAGNGRMLDQVLLKPGKYDVFLQFYDISSSPGHSTLVLQSAQGIVVSPPFPPIPVAQPQSVNGTSSGQ
jgi:hypothetical protein